MNFGEKLKQLRTDKNWTQPQLAEAIGIEQSYLSKLENDKSIPSADIFQAILKAFVLDVASLLDGIDDTVIHRQLRQIPEVAQYLNAGITVKIHNIKKWLFSSAAACVLGATLIVAGQKSLLFNTVQFEYRSDGVLFAGEPMDMIRNWENYDTADQCVNTLEGDCAKVEIARKEKSKVMAARLQFDTMFTPIYQGQYIYREVNGGSRAYELKRTASIEYPANRYLILLGSLLGFSGLFGFFVEYRLRKI